MPTLPANPARCLAAATIAVIVSACATSGKTPETRLQKGLSYLSEGKTEKAVSLLEKEFAADYSNPAVHRAYVQAMARAGRLQDAEAEYKARLNVEPRWAARYGLGLIHFIKSPATAAEAVEDFKAAVTLAPNHPDVRFRLGLVQLEMEDYKSACATFEEGVKIAPSMPGMRPPYAQCLLMTGRPAAAREQLAALTAMEPSEKEVEQAQAVMTRINNPFMLLPGSLEADYSKAVDLLEKYDIPAKAIEILEMISAKHPELAPVRLMLGMAYSRVNDNARAISELRTASELAPESAAVWQAMAGIYQGLDRFDQAADFYAKALKLDPLSTTAYVQLGSLYVNRGEYEKAVPLMQAIVHLHSGRDDFRFLLGRTLQLAGKIDEAEKQFQWLVDRNKEGPHGLVGLGYVYAVKRMRERDPVKREELFKKAWNLAAAALNGDPNFEGAKNLVDYLKSQRQAAP